MSLLQLDSLKVAPDYVLYELKYFENAVHAFPFMEANKKSLKIS